MAQLGEAAEAPQSSASAVKTHNTMVKLFARRAAAHVELQELEQAKADLQEVSQHFCMLCIVPVKMVLNVTVR